MSTQNDLFEGSLFPDNYEYISEYEEIEEQEKQEIIIDVAEENNTGLAVINTAITASPNLNNLLNIQNVKTKMEWLKDFQELLFKELKKDIDYMKIQGSYMLTKAGSSKASFLTNSVCSFTIKDSIVEHETGLFSYTIEAIVTDKNNPDLIYGKGVGSCSTYDSSTYYEYIEENKLPFYYLQFINFDKYIKPEIDKLQEFKEKYNSISPARVQAFEMNFERKFKTRLVDNISKKTLELEDIETRLDKNQYTKVETLKYRVPKKEINLAQLNHKVREMALKRAEAFAYRRAFNLDEILKRIENDDKKTDDNNGNPTSTTKYTTHACKQCGKKLTEKEAKYSIIQCYKCKVAAGK